MAFCSIQTPKTIRDFQNMAGSVSFTNKKYLIEYHAEYKLLYLI